ncbi:hypothetical protein FA95DRAFT_1605524 [Auriscalpium vulgare]|uniref:Uncharacterized protein n=1 Tax=Auriscalpium vulgare TaxID=40419 RepID=A0ACB8RW40_9AGAM|nr:hypothetical protein FA95DRAFT_1605524 [Auriscalpium vulgare]
MPTIDPDISSKQVEAVGAMLAESFLGHMFPHEDAADLVCRRIMQFPNGLPDDDFNYPWGLVIPSPPNMPGAFAVSTSIDFFPRDHLTADPQAVPPSPPFVISDFKVPALGTTQVIPQLLWIPYKDTKRKLEPVMAPVFFVATDRTVGIPLLTATTAQSNPKILLNPDHCPFGDKSTLKVVTWFLGYKRKEYKTEEGKPGAKVNLRQTDGPHASLSRILQSVAVHLKTRIEDMQRNHKSHLDETCPLDSARPGHQWWSDRGGLIGVSLEAIVLVGLVAVSPGAVMPILEVRG